MSTAFLLSVTLLALPGGEATAQDLPGIPAPDRAVVRASAGWLLLTWPPVASLRGLGSAHPGARRISVNRSRAQLTDAAGRQRFPYPRRTVVVKASTSGGRTSLVAIMRRVSAGSAPSAWRYVEYTRDPGEEAFTKVGGGQTLCSSCHMLASTTQRSDYAFTRLAPAPRR